MAHPQFTLSSMQSRRALRQSFQGKFGLWFCGAWDGYGFHEDGCRSGFDVAYEIMTKHGDDDKENWVKIPFPPPTILSIPSSSFIQKLYKFWTCTVPITVCKKFLCAFLHRSIHHGLLEMRCLSNDSILRFGETTSKDPVSLLIYDDWFFVKVCFEYDLGLARSYMAGLFHVLEPQSEKDAVLYKPSSENETNDILGDPVGLTRLFLLFIANRDSRLPSRSAKTWHSPLTTAMGLSFLSKIGTWTNYFKYKFFMNNTEEGGSLDNIHAHYNISNSLFFTFLDKDTFTYSSAIYSIDPKNTALVNDTLEQAQKRKLDTLLSTAGIDSTNGPSLTLLDIGFGWGGLSIRAAQKYKCNVVGITLSREQMSYAQEKVKSLGLEALISYHVIDYRTFARDPKNKHKFDRIISCEMIEAVGHRHLNSYFAAVNALIKTDGIFVMEAITTPEVRYETYKRSTDFINTVIFPGSCCPSLHALVDASYQASTLTLQRITNINLHYAETLREWRRRFNAHEDFIRRGLGFDPVFLRAWNYYLTYCEAGFYSMTENCLILKWSRVDGGLWEQETERISEVQQ